MVSSCIYPINIDISRPCRVPGNRIGIQVNQSPVKTYERTNNYNHAGHIHLFLVDANLLFIDRTGFRVPKQFNLVNESKKRPGGYEPHHTIRRRSGGLPRACSE